MRRTPVFGDPKTDFVFQRVFGSEDHMTALLGFLNDLLQLDDAHRINSVVLLPPEQRPRVDELKNSIGCGSFGAADESEPWPPCWRRARLGKPEGSLEAGARANRHRSRRAAPSSIVDVKCVDAAGTTYVVEMQVLNVEAFEKRVVYNVAKAYTNQLSVGFAYPELDDVIGITVCNFELWPHRQAPHVPMLSRRRMAEQESGVKGLPHLQFVFLELPKYAAGHEPKTSVDKWAYFFREAGNLMAIPEALQEPPLLDALEGARTARFNREEWDAYIAAGMAIQNELGALSLARKQGEAAARARDVLTILRVRGIAVPDAVRERILAEKDPALLERWLEKAAVASSAIEVIGD